MLDQNQQEWIDGLRDLADFLEDRPVLIPKGMFGVEITPIYLDGYYKKENFAEAIISIGKAEKTSSSYYLGFERKFGPHRLRVMTQHEGLCEKKVTKVTKMVREPRYTVPTDYHEVEREVEEVEWICPPSILAAIKDDD